MLSIAQSPPPYSVRFHIPNISSARQIILYAHISILSLSVATSELQCVPQDPDLRRVPAGPLAFSRRVIFFHCKITLSLSLVLHSCAIPGAAYLLLETFTRARHHVHPQAGYRERMAEAHKVRHPIYVDRYCNVYKISSPLRAVDGLSLPHIISDSILLTLLPDPTLR